MIPLSRRTLLASTVLWLAAAPWTLLPARAEDWKEISRTAELTISTRPRAGSPIAEVRAVGRIEAPPAVVRAVLDDRDHYPQFMPYVAETRVISGSAGAGNTLIAYMRLSPPLVGQRDYTIAVHDEPRKAPDGSTIYFNHWELANEKGPAEKPGVVRVKVNEGSWLLEPTDNGAATRATYTLFTDAGGSVPTMIINTANKRSPADLFRAVRKAAADPHYRR